MEVTVNCDVALEGVHAAESVGSYDEMRSEGGEAVTLHSLVLRSLFPITTLLVVFGTLLWGPWVSLIVAYAWWKLVARVG